MKEGEKDKTIAISDVSLAMVPKNLDEAMRFAQEIAKSEIVPKGDIGKPGNILVKMMLGMELGVGPLTALQNIACINGIPSVYGDLALALARSSGQLEEFQEFNPAEAIKNGKGWCKIKRKGYEPKEYEFTMEMAKTAGLWGKAGPWSQYPGRMLQMRNRSFALRDLFGDSLKGLKIAEEVMDYEVEAKIDEKTEVVKPRRKTEKKEEKTAGVPEQTIASDAEVVNPEQERSVFVERVTKSAFGDGNRYFVTLEGNKLHTDSLEMANIAKSFMEKKVPVMYKSEGDALLSIMSA